MFSIVLYVRVIDILSIVSPMSWWQIQYHFSTNSESRSLPLILNIKILQLQACRPSVVRLGQFNLWQGGLSFVEELTITGQQEDKVSTLPLVYVTHCITYILHRYDLPSIRLWVRLVSKSDLWQGTRVRRGALQLGLQCQLGLLWDFSPSPTFRSSKSLATLLLLFLCLHFSLVSPLLFPCARYPV